MAGMSGNGKLRQWLIDQVDGGKYPGLVWEDREKSTFRIPWKHAGKQDYNREEDAALFKAWALFKGKYREGIDKPDPPTWKTRLRCALNKSNDFEELVQKSQLDTSEPYKVYRVIPEGTKRASCERTFTMTSPDSLQQYPAYTPLPSQVSNYPSPGEKGWSSTSELSPFPDFYHPYCSNSYTPSWDPAGYQINNSFYSCSGFDPSLSTFEQNMRSVAFSDPRLQVSVFSGDSLLREMTVFSTEGCRLAPYEENQNYGGPELVQLPHCEGTELERGVLVWLAPDGLCARRLCNARVYWELASNTNADKPNKLERNQTSKLLDIQQFMAELQGYSYLQARPPPCFQVLLYFEQCHDIHAYKRPITVQVEPLFARQLFILSQQSNTHHLRTPENSPLLWEQMPLSQHNCYSWSSHQQDTLQDYETHK